MRNILSGLGFLTASLLMSCGDKEQKIDASAVPPAVMTSFSNAYPGAGDAKWEKEMEDGKAVYEVHFTFDGKKSEASYDESGNAVDE